MDIFDGLRVVLRWWFVTVPLLVISILGALLLTRNIQPEYTAEAAILFVGPSVREVEVDDTIEFESVNPLIEQPASLATAALVASLKATSPQIKNILADEGLSTDYETGVQDRTPVLLLLIRAQSEDVPIATALRLVDLIEQDIRTQQAAADIPPDQAVTISVIGLSSVGGADYGGRNRARIAMVAFGAGASFGAAFFLEGRRRRRESAKRHTPAETDEASEQLPSKSPGAGKTRNLGRQKAEAGDHDKPTVPAR
jgi:hypothetical protein